MSSSTRTKCSICENTLDEKDHIVTTDCQHTFHLVCAQNRLNTNKWECKKCSIDNELSTNRCEGCGALRYTPTTNSYVTTQEVDSNQTNSSYNSSVSTKRGNCFSQHVRFTLFVRLFVNS